MLLVNAFAGPSRIHGTGLIAREFIAAGTLVWELRPGFDLELTREEVERLSSYSQEQVRRYIYIDVITGKYVLCSDDAKFMNHSDSPNTRTAGTQTVAVHDIAAGEELTCDYAEFDAATRRGLTMDADYRQQAGRPRR